MRQIEGGSAGSGPDRVSHGLVALADAEGFATFALGHGPTVGGDELIAARLEFVSLAHHMAERQGAALVHGVKDDLALRPLGQRLEAAYADAEPPLPRRP